MSNESTTETKINAYLLEAQSWELDKAETDKRSMRIAWIIAGIMTFIAILALSSLRALMPLKEIQNNLIRVDSSTGVVDIVPKYEGTTDIDPIVSHLILTQYVLARERYFYAIAESDYEFVSAFNTPKLNEKWSAHWAITNPKSPLNVYKDGTTVRVVISAVTSLKLESGNANVVQVRFMEYLRPGGSGEEIVRHWISTIQYGYVAPSEDNKLRSLNPLGFRVVEYIKEPVVANPSDKEG